MTSRHCSSDADSLRRAFTITANVCIVAGVTSFGMQLAPGLQGASVLLALTLACAALGLPCVLAAMYFDRKARR